MNKQGQPEPEHPQMLMASNEYPALNEGSRQALATVHSTNTGSLDAAAPTSISSASTSKNPHRDPPSADENTQSLGEIWFRTMKPPLDQRNESRENGNAAQNPNDKQEQQQQQQQHDGQLPQERLRLTKFSNNNSSAHKSMSSLSTIDGSESERTPVETASCNKSSRRDSTCSHNSTSSTNENTVSSSNKKRKVLSEDKRQERNLREQERSHRISDRFAELRELLVGAGIVMPRGGTKGSILAITLEYIRFLRDAQMKRDAECTSLRQQIKNLQQGVLGPQVAMAVQQAAKQYAIQSIIPSHGNVYSAPGMMVNQTNPSLAYPDGSIAPISTASSSNDNSNCNSQKVDFSVLDSDSYHQVFDQNPVPMAIASLGGSLLDCNRLFCDLCQHSLDEVRKMSVFNLTTKDQLSYAFDRLKSLLSAESAALVEPVLLGASIAGLGLQVRLLDREGLQDQDGCAKMLLVTLVTAEGAPLPLQKPAMENQQDEDTSMDENAKKDADEVTSLPFYSIA